MTLMSSQASPARSGPVAWIAWRPISPRHSTAVPKPEVQYIGRLSYFCHGMLDVTGPEVAQHSDAARCELEDACHL